MSIKAELNHHYLVIDLDNGVVDLFYKDGDHCRELDEYETTMVIAAFYAGMGVNNGQ